MPLNREDKAQVFVCNLLPTTTLHLSCFHFRFEENKYFKRIGKIIFLPNAQENVFEKFGLERKGRALKHSRPNSSFLPTNFRIYTHIYSSDCNSNKREEILYHYSLSLSLLFQSRLYLTFERTFFFNSCSYDDAHCLITQSVDIKFSAAKWFSLLKRTIVIFDNCPRSPSLRNFNRSQFATVFQYLNFPIFSLSLVEEYIRI